MISPKKRLCEGSKLRFYQNGELEVESHINPRFDNWARLVRVNWQIMKNLWNTSSTKVKLKLCARHHTNKPEIFERNREQSENHLPVPKIAQFSSQLPSQVQQEGKWSALFALCRVCLSSIHLPKLCVNPQNIRSSSFASYSEAIFWIQNVRQLLSFTGGLLTLPDPLMSIWPVIGSGSKPLDD